MVVAKMTTSPLIWATDGPVGPQKRGNWQKSGFRGEGKFSVGHVQFEVLWDL